MRWVKFLKNKALISVFVFSALALTPMYAEDKDAGGGDDADTATNTPEQIQQPITMTRGIVSCQGARLQQIGKLTPTVAQFVPVWDEVVSYNTNLLLYKECVLDAINNRLKQAFIASVVKDAVRVITGDGRNPQFVTNLEEHLKKRKKKRLEKLISENELGAVCSPFKDKIIESIKQTFEEEQDPVACSLDEARLKACAEGDLKNCGGLEGFYKSVLNPNNNPLFAYFNAALYTQQKLLEEEQNERQILDWGRGFKPVRKEETITLDDGTVIKKEIIQTPGYLIAQYAGDIIGTGLRQLEAADELNEIIGALMQQIGTAAITGTGFTGLAVSEYGSPSYLDMLTNESGEGVRSGIIRQYYEQLTAALKNAVDYLKAMQNYLKSVNKAENILRNQEISCIEGAAGVIFYAKQAVKNKACNSWYPPQQGTGSSSAQCPVTVEVKYNPGTRILMETYEPSLGYARSVAYLNDTTQAEFWFNAISYKFGNSTVSAASSLFGPNYKFFSKPAFAATSTVPNGTIKPYLKQGQIQTNSGEFKFTKEEIGLDGYKQYMLTFGYDLPDVVITAKHPTTTQTISITLNLDKRHSKQFINTKPEMQSSTKRNFYQKISEFLRYIDEIKQTQKALSGNPTQEDLDKAQALISGFPDTDIQGAYNNIQSINAAASAILTEAQTEAEFWYTKEGNWCSSAVKDSFGRTYARSIRNAFCDYLSAQAKAQFSECNGL